MTAIVSFVPDLIIALILLLCIVIYTKRGLVRSLCGLLVTVAAIVIAVNFRAPLVSYFRTTPVAAKLEDTVEQSIGSYFEKTLASAMPESTDAAAADLPDDADVAFPELPDGMSQLLDRFGISLPSLTDSIRSSASDTLHALTEKVSATVVGTLLDVVAFALLFFGSLIVLKLLVFLLDRIFRLPVLRHINRFGGFVLGLAMGVLFACLFCRLAEALTPSLVTSGVLASPDVFDKAILFPLFSKTNFLPFL